jgi:spermine/spermidine synthase
MDEPEAQGHRKVAAAALGAAFFAAALLILLREFMVLSGGAETSVVAVLGAALCWVGLGALLGRYLESRVKVNWSPLALAALPPLFVIELWAARAMIAGVAGEENIPLFMHGLGLAAIALSAPLALVCGLLLPSAARGGGGAARVWPAVSGGLATGAAGIALSSGLHCGQLLAAACVCGIYAPLVSAVLGPGLLRRGKMALAAWTLVISGGALYVAVTPLLEAATLASADRGGGISSGGERPAKELDAPCGNLVVMSGDGDASSIYRNGLRCASYPDPYARDDAVFACSQARVLGRVLVIGGGRPELVRELLARGAFNVDVMELDRGVGEALEPHLSDSDREALESPRVKTLQGNFRRPLREIKAGSYDLVVLTMPEPRSVASGGLYSVEFLARVAVSLVRRGALVAVLPGGRSEKDLFGSRVWATFWELGEKKLLSDCVVHPGKRWRVAASPLPGGLPGSAGEAAKRYRLHRMPGGGETAPAGDEDFARLVQVNRARKFTEALDGYRKSEDLVRESTLTPRIHLDYFLSELSEASPVSAKVLDRIIRLHLWVPFAALLVLFLVGGLIARRKRGTVPSSFTLLAAAGATGLIGTGVVHLASSTYGLLAGTLYGAAPLLLAALFAGCGLGASLAGKVGANAVRSPRRLLATVAFGFALLLLLGWQSVNLPPGSALVDLAHGLGLAVLGFLAGLQLSLIGSCLALKASPHAVAARLALSTGLGALLGSALAVSEVLAAMGPSASYLLLLGVDVVALGLMAAGVGHRRTGGGSSTSLPSPLAATKESAS